MSFKLIFKTLSVIMEIKLGFIPCSVKTCVKYLYKLTLEVKGIRINCYSHSRVKPKKCYCENTKIKFLLWKNLASVLNSIQFHYMDKIKIKSYRFIKNTNLQRHEGEYMMTFYWK